MYDDGSWMLPKMDFKEEALAVMESGGTSILPAFMIFKQMRPEFRDDEEIVLEALRHGADFSHASPRLRRDREFVKKAIECNPHSIGGADGQYKNDVELAQIAIKKDPVTILGFGFEIKDNYDLVLQAVSNYDRDKNLSKTSILEYISPRLQDNEEIVLAAVKNGDDIKWASDRIRDNEQIAMEAVKKNGFALGYISPRLREKKDIIIAALKQNHNAYESVPESMRANEEVIDVIKDDMTIWGDWRPKIFNYHLTPEIRAVREKLLSSPIETNENDKVEEEKPILMNDEEKRVEDIQESREEEKSEVVEKKSDLAHEEEQQKSNDDSKLLSLMKEILSSQKGLIKRMQELEEKVVRLEENDKTDSFSGMGK